MKMYLKIVLLLLTAGFITCSVPAFAQQTGFSGTITDVQGGAIVGAKVEVKQTGGASFFATTNAQGQYVIPSVTAAEYTIRATAPGFSTAEKKILLLVGQLATIDLSLPIASTSSTVIVEASSTLAIDTTSSVVAGNVTPSEVQDTPVNGRNYNELAALVPGIKANALSNADVPVAGGDAETGKFQITMDMLQVSQSSIGSSFGQPRFSQDAISQFQIITNRFDATAGRSAGLYINVQSKGGTNEMHGGFFGYFRNSFFNADDPFYVPPGSTTGKHTALPFSDQQFGGTFGGAIKKNKLWYFASFEGERQPNTYTNTPTVTNTLFSHPTLLTQDDYLTRFDYQVNDRNHIFVRGDGFNLKDAYDGAADPSTASSDSRYTYGYVADWNHNITDRLINDVHAGFHYFITNFQPLYLTPVLNLSDPTVLIGSPYNRPETFTQPTQQYRDDLFWLKGKHNFKLGGEYLYLLMGGYFPQNSRGSISCANSTALNYATLFPDGTTDASTWNYNYLTSNCGTITYVQGFGSYNLHIPRNIIGVWAQDDWKILPRLTLNLGIRYDNDLGAFLNNLKVNNGLLTPNSNPNANFSPRVGFAYDLAGDGKTSIRGGAGLYYADINGNPTIDDSLFNGVTTVQATVQGSAASFTGTLNNPFAGQNPLATPGNYIQTPQYIERGASTPYSFQASFGVARELGWRTTMTADLVHQRVYKDAILLDGNLLQSPNNPYQNLDPNPDAPMSAATYGARVCPNGGVALDTITGNLSSAAPGGSPALQVCNQHFSAASSSTGFREFSYTNGAGDISDGLNVGIKHAVTSGFTGAIAWTWGRTKNSTNGAFSYPNKPFKNGIQQEWANGTDDQRHTITINGEYKWKYGLMVSSLYHFGSGLAYASTSGESGLNGYTASTRTFSLGTAAAPVFVTPIAPGAVCPGGTCVTVYAPLSKIHLDPTYGYYIIERDAIRGAAYHRADLRLQETIKIHTKYSAILGVESFNVLNHTNYGAYGGTATSNSASTGYGHPLAASSSALEYQARSFQFFGRFSF